MSKIDLSKPPYTVPCPSCHAYGMTPCRDQVADLAVRELRGLNAPGKMLPEPHDDRWLAWHRHPELRSKVLDDTYTRWSETFAEWAARMRIHCPTALNIHELMFFAAEKLDLTTTDYLLQYFPELVKPAHLNELKANDTTLWNSLLAQLPP